MGLNERTTCRRKMQGATPLWTGGTNPGPWLLKIRPTMRRLLKMLLRSAQWASPTFRKWVFGLWNIALSVNDYIAHRTDGTGMSTSTFTIKINHVGEYTSPMDPSGSCLVQKRHVSRVEAFFESPNNLCFAKLEISDKHLETHLSPGHSTAPLIGSVVACYSPW